MDSPDLPRSPLTRWALAVIAETAIAAGHRPVEPTPRLRLALAWLSTAINERAAVEQFWADARQVLSDQQTDARNRYIRKTALRLSIEGICERAGSSWMTVREYAERQRQDWP